MCGALALLLVAAPAVASDGAESTWVRWASMAELEVRPELIRRLDGRATLSSGPLRVELDGGYLVPVLSGRFAGVWQRHAERWLEDQREAGAVAPRLPSAEERGSTQFVGFVWIGGEGAVRVELPDRADALVLANRLVRGLGYDREALAPVARRDAPFTTTASEGWVLSIDPEVEAIYAGAEPEADLYEVTVFENSGEARQAMRRAKALVAERLSLLDDLDLGAGRAIASDRLAEERGLGGASGTFGLLDFRTGHRYGYVAPASHTRDVERDSWLTALRDDLGGVYRRRRVTVGSLGRARDGRPAFGLVSGELHPTVVPGDPLSASAPAVRVEPIRAESVVYAARSRNGLTLDLDISSRITVEAVGGPIQWFALRLPSVEVVPGTWEIVKLELEDGTNLLGQQVARKRPKSEKGPLPEPPDPPEPQPEPPPPPDDQTERTRVAVVLPQPLQPGERARIRVRHKDTWPLSGGTSNCGIEGTDAGTGSGLQSFLPALVGGATGDPWPFSLRVAVPAQDRLLVAASGDTERTWEAEGWRWLASSSGERPALWPSVAIGKWHGRVEPAHGAFPGVRVHLQSGSTDALDRFGPETRRVVDYLQKWLPPFPVREIDVFQAPDMCGGFVWIAPHGMVSVAQMKILGSLAYTGHNPRWDRPHLESGVYAHELAHQYWGHLAPPASREDFWLAETFAEVYSCMYVGAAFGEAACDKRMDRAREQWERPAQPIRQASLSRAYYDSRQPDIVYRYGPYVFWKMLRARIGDGAWFAGLDLLLVDHADTPITTERLQRYLSVASRRNLRDFFDFWVHGGFVPALELTWHQEAGRVVGVLSADVPFGTFDVQVRAVDATGETHATWVEVVDGEGALSLDVADARKVEVDPDHLVLATARRSHRSQ